MARLLDDVFSKGLETVRLLVSHSGFTVELGDVIRARGGVDRAIVALTREFFPVVDAAIPPPDLVHGLFASAREQIVLVRKWNAERQWGFTEADFERVAENIPAWPEDRLVALVLVPYLPEKKGISGIERAFQELWLLAGAQQKNRSRWDGYEKAGPERLRLHEGIEHQPGLRWEVIDLGANWDKDNGISPEEIRGSKSPHAGILAAAALHPSWVCAMDGREVPYVWIPGYEVTVPGFGASWTDVPRLWFLRSVARVYLYARWRDSRYSHCAVPVLRD